MDMQKLFSTKEREKIFFYLLDHSLEIINQRRTARVLRVSHSQVHKYVSLLRSQGIVKKDVLQNTLLICLMRAVKNLSEIEKNKVAQIVKKQIPAAKGVGVYGSWTHGTNYEKTDLDLWVKTSKNPPDLQVAKARKEIEKKVGVPVDLTCFDEGRLKQIKEKSESFYFSLHNSIKIWGENL